MKRFQKILMTACGAALVCSCVSLKNVQQNPPVSVSLADRMEIENGQVNLDLNVDIPAEYASSHTGIQVRPMIVGDNGKVVLPALIIEGNKHDRFNDRIDLYAPAKSDSIALRSKYVKGGETHYLYKEVTEFQEWMKNGQICVDIFADAYTKRVNIGQVSMETEILDLTPYIVNQPLVYFFNLSELEKYTAFIGGPYKGDDFSLAFPTGSDVIKTDLSREGFIKYMDVMKACPELVSYQVNVLVSNSPEATVKYNTDLGQRRIAAIENFLSELEIPAENRNLSMTVEDWNGLLLRLPSLNLKHADSILEIIRTTEDLDKRESLIRARYPQDWRVICADVFPDLCRADIGITAVVKGKDGQLRKVTARGFYYNDAYPVEVNEVHFAMLDAVREGDIEKAAEIADSIDNERIPDVIRCNKGTIYMLAGRYDDARIVLERVEGIREAEYNLGLAYLLLGNWEKADQFLNRFSDQNSAVAKMYNRDYAGAADVIKFLPESPAKQELSEKLERLLKI